MWPYEETSLQRGTEPRHYLLVTPWLCTEIETTEVGSSHAELILNATDASPNHELLKNYSELLQAFKNEPFCYLMPRYDLPFGLDQFEERYASVPPMQPSWDRVAILQLSEIQPTQRYDPLTIFSACRRFFYLDAVENETTEELFDGLDALRASENRFKAGAAFLLAQTFYITNTAEEALSAAFPQAQRTKTILEKFIRSERGHDRLFATALKSIGSCKITTPHPSTIILMKTLKKIAETNFLAFAFALSLFERRDVVNVEKLTSILTKGGLNEAAAVVAKHSVINEQGNHDAIGIKLLETMAPVSPSYAKNAISWAEYISFLINTHSASLLAELRSEVFDAA